MMDTSTWHFGCNHDHSSLLVARAGMTEEEKREENLVIRTKFRRAIYISFFFLVIESIGGYFSKSLAIWSDASHLLSDFISLLVSLAASHLSDLPKDHRNNFGWRRIESLAAFLSMISLLLLTLYLVALAMGRLVLGTEKEINGKIMSGISLTGIFVNACLLLVLGEHHHVGHVLSSPPPNPEKTRCNMVNPNDAVSVDLFSVDIEMMGVTDDDDEEETALLMNDNDVDEEELAKPLKESSNISSVIMTNVNLRATYLHILGDFLQSIGVLVASLIIWAFPSTAKWVDPLCTFLFCLWVISNTLPVIRSSLSLLLLQVPDFLDYNKIKNEMEGISGVSRVEELQIFSVSQEEVAMNMHLLVKEAEWNEHVTARVLEQVQTVAQRYSITKTTTQIVKEPPRPSLMGRIFEGVQRGGAACKVCS